MNWIWAVVVGVIALLVWKADAKRQQPLIPPGVVKTWQRTPAAEPVVVPPAAPPAVTPPAPPAPPPPTLEAKPKKKTAAKTVKAKAPAKPIKKAKQGKPTKKAKQGKPTRSGPKPSAAPTAVKPAKDPRCAEVFAAGLPRYIAMFGETFVFNEARRRGHSEAEIVGAKRCLRR